MCGDVAGAPPPASARTHLIGDRWSSATVALGGSAFVAARGQRCRCWAASRLPASLARWIQRKVLGRIASSCASSDPPRLGGTRARAALSLSRARRSGPPHRRPPGQAAPAAEGGRLRRLSWPGRNLRFEKFAAARAAGLKEAQLHERRGPASRLPALRCSSPRARHYCRLRGKPAGCSAAVAASRSPRYSSYVEGGTERLNVCSCPCVFISNKISHQAAFLSPHGLRLRAAARRVVSKPRSDGVTNFTPVSPSAFRARKILEQCRRRIDASRLDESDDDSTSERSP